MGNLLDRNGERRGMMTALTPTHVKLSSGRNMPAWRCRCDCGVEKDIMTVNWVKDKHRSCGCNRPATISARYQGHGKNPLYRVWTQMRQRCHETYAANHKWYGARGITVCDRWRFGEDGKSGFECFIEDMGPRPDGLTLDRINVNGDYEPGNCRWATWKEQANNKQARAA